MKIKITKDVAGCEHLRAGTILDVNEIPEALRFSYEIVEEPKIEVATPKKTTKK